MPRAAFENHLAGAPRLQGVLCLSHHEKATAVCKDRVGITRFTLNLGCFQPSSSGDFPLKPENALFLGKQVPCGHITGLKKKKDIRKMKVLFLVSHFLRKTMFRKSLYCLAEEVALLPFGKHNGTLNPLPPRASASGTPSHQHASGTQFLSLLCFRPSCVCERVVPHWHTAGAQ